MPLRQQHAVRAAVVTVSLVVAACASASPSAPASAARVATGQRTAGPDAAPGLAAMLPATAGGDEFVKSSFTGSDLAGVGVSLDAEELERLATAEGRTLADVEVAEARPVDPRKGGIVLAIHVPGADPKEVVDATFSESAGLRLATLGGKSVYRVAASGLNVVVYPKDDILFQVLGAPADLTEAVIAALP